MKWAALGVVMAACSPKGPPPKETPLATARDLAERGQALGTLRIRSLHGDLDARTVCADESAGLVAAIERLRDEARGDLGGAVPHLLACASCDGDVADIACIQARDILTPRR